jgi:hypothetical protein
MFVIVNKHNDSMHREPSRKQWQTMYYNSEAAAKAGITRTIKYYEKAKAEVAKVVAEGKPDYHARMYNAYRLATDPVLGRTHEADKNNYRVMHADEYALIEPIITTTRNCPGTGKPITYTRSINEPSYLNPQSESYWSA